MNIILLFGMPGGAELFFIVLVVIMLFGSKKIPELARGLGKGMREIKNATGDIQREITEGAREVNSIKNKVNVEKQVKELIKEEKDKKQEAGEDEKENYAETKKQETTSSKPENKSPKTVSETVQRRRPYIEQGLQNTSEET